VIHFFVLNHFKPWTMVIHFFVLNHYFCFVLFVFAFDSYSLFCFALFCIKFLFFLWIIEEELEDTVIEYRRRDFA